tara:strand:+ start:637 stop:849 length:213 start_codon:yes stop_codon:yes gene_type:complete
MLTKDSGIDNGKFSNKLSRKKKSKPISQAIGAEDKGSYHKKITAAYYRVKKRGFDGNNFDAMQDWLEADI